MGDLPLARKNTFFFGTLRHVLKRIRKERGRFRSSVNFCSVKLVESDWYRTFSLSTCHLLRVFFLCERWVSAVTHSRTQLVKAIRVSVTTSWSLAVPSLNTHMKIRERRAWNIFSFFRSQVDMEFISWRPWERSLTPKYTRTPLFSFYITLHPLKGVQE